MSSAFIWFDNSQVDSHRKEGSQQCGPFLFLAHWEEI